MTVQRHSSLPPPLWLKGLKDVTTEASAFLGRLLVHLLLTHCIKHPPSAASRVLTAFALKQVSQAVLNMGSLVFLLQTCLQHAGSVPPLVCTFCVIVGCTRNHRIDPEKLLYGKQGFTGQGRDCQTISCSSSKNQEATLVIFSPVKMFASADPSRAQTSPHHGVKVFAAGRRGLQRAPPTFVSVPRAFDAQIPL